ncbi:MAG: hypothetical protein V7K88_03410 [Nostoc sp.]|uniref:WD40 repeat domain-containing protein n=1 Tax=Nostoc sp. TaxID=1180 RepID=UPI002FF61D44
MPHCGQQNLLASVSADRTIKLWSPHTGQCLKTLYGHGSWVWAIAFSPDSNFLASGSYDHTVKIWDVHSGECLQTLPGHPGCVLAIAFSPDGKTLISNSAVARMKQSIAGILLQGNAGQLYGQPVPMKA